MNHNFGVDQVAENSVNEEIMSIWIEKEEEFPEEHVIRIYGCTFMDHPVGCMG